MGQNFITCDRGQVFLMPPHLVWTVLGAVVALLLYSYSLGILSSRGIEKACRVDVAYKVITAMAVPDHSRIAEFRRRHELALGEVFVQVLGLCREAGLVSVGVIAIDGTKVKANASRDQNRSYVSIVSDLDRWVAD